MTLPNTNTTPPTYIVVDLTGSSIRCRILSRKEQSETGTFDEKTQKVKENKSMCVGWDYLFCHFLVLTDTLLCFETFVALVTSLPWVRKQRRPSASAKVGN